MEGEQGSLNGRREVIRGELRRNVMGQLKDQIYLEDEQLYEQIDTAIRQKGKETYLPLKERLWLRNSLYDSFRRLDILQELLDEKHIIYVNFRDDNENGARAKNAELRRAKISDATFDILMFYMQL